jgi:hypothetical protein
MSIEEEALLAIGNWLKPKNQNRGEGPRAKTNR